MRKGFKAKLNGDESRKDASASFTLPFDTRQVWSKAKVPVKVTINGYTGAAQSGTGEEFSTSLPKHGRRA
jgi:hypothetical protein